MTVSRLAYSVRLQGGDLLSPEGGQVTMDESWSPYIGGQLTVPLPEDPALVQALDPRAGARLHVRMSQQFGSAFTIGDLTAGEGTSTAAWTTGLAGAPLSTWTGRYSTPYNASGSRASRIRTFDLGVRERAIDYDAGVVDLTPASDEALLQDMRNLTATRRTPTSETILAAVTMALASIGAVVVTSVPDVQLEPGSASWEPGQSAWDYVQPLVDAAGLRLWCDEGRVWHLDVPNVPEGSALAFSGGTVKRLRDTVGRDEGWYDAVHITYRWRDSSDVEQVRYDVAQLPEYSKVYAVEYSRPYPGPGAAAALLERVRGRGRSEGVAAVSNPTASPRRPLTVNLPDAPIQTGFITQVRWDLEQDEMTILTRDLTDTPPTAWVLTQGTWQDVAGIAWADVETEQEG